MDIHGPLQTRGEIRCPGGVIKIITQISKVIKTVYKKNIKTSARVGYVPPVWKRGQVQGLKESRLTIREIEDQGLVASEEVWTSPDI